MMLWCFSQFSVAEDADLSVHSNIALTITTPPNNSAYSGELYTRQRALFADFIETIEVGRNNKEQQILQKLSELKGYPLYSYAVKYWLQASMNMQSAKNVSAFLDSYDDSPVALNVRKRWLQRTLDSNDVDTFIEFYRPGISAELDCYYLRKTLASHHDTQALDEKVLPLWMVSFSQPRACDPLFKRWKQAGLNTPERQFQRMKLASREGNLKLARYLAREVPSELQYLVVLWRDAHNSPHKLINLKRFNRRFPEQEAEVFSHAMQKLVWSNPDRVIRIYNQALTTLALSDLQQQRLARAIALSLAVDNHPDADAWLQRALDLKQEKELLRWQIATKVRQGNWQGTLDAIEQAPSSLSDDVIYDYWEGRSWQQLGADDKSSEALQIAAQQRHYYGFLASAKLGQVPALNHRNPEWDDQIQLQLGAQPAIQRAFELFATQRYSEARREWRFALAEMNAEQKLQSALLAYEWQWFDQAIFGLAQAGFWDDVARRFPIAFNSRITPFAKEQQVDPAWAFAIARRESSFMVDAISSAGARGLMQVLPATAQHISRQRLPYKALLEPDTNVALGVQYLRYLMDKVDNNPILATASYNAGWRRVLNWIPASEAVDMDIWIETIPFRETRNYVKAVLAYKYIYQVQLGQQSEVFKQLSGMQMMPIKPAP